MENAINPEINNSEVSSKETKSPKKTFFQRRKAFVDPHFKNMKYNRFDTYEENKQDYYDTLRLVFTGKCKNIYEAYALNH